MKCSLHACVIVSAALFACAPATPGPESGPDVSAAAGPEVTEFGLTVGDLESARQLFVDVLGAEVVRTADAGGPELAALTGLPEARATAVHLRLGRERVLLVQFGERGKSWRSDARSTDLEFQHLAIVVRDIDEAHERGMAAGLRPVSSGGPQRIPDSNAAAAGIRAFYFRGLGGHPLELIWFPSDKRQPRWHESSGPLVLGIDHSAITVSSTEDSLAFYRDGIGLSIVGQSANQGVEQEPLSGVDGAHVRITGLRGRRGPGVELLEYLWPRGGRPRTSDSTPRDSFHWEMGVRVADLERAVAKLIAAGAESVSTRIARCELCVVGRRAFVLRDPDGHAVRLVEE